jgi:hypothetical protein
VILPKIYELDKDMGIHKIAKKDQAKIGNGHRKDNKNNIFEMSKI